MNVTDVERIGPGTVFSQYRKGRTRTIYITHIGSWHGREAFFGFLFEQGYDRPVGCTYTKTYLSEDCHNYWMIKL